MQKHNNTIISYRRLAAVHLVAIVTVLLSFAVGVAGLTIPWGYCDTVHPKRYKRKQCEKIKFMLKACHASGAYHVLIQFPNRKAFNLFDTSDIVQLKPLVDADELMPPRDGRNI